RAAFRRGLLRATGIAAACAAVLIGLLLSITVQHPLNLAQRLPDGTVLRLEAVTYGKQHHFESGPFRLAWLRRLFPWLARLISPSADNTTPRDALVVWFTRRDATGRSLTFTPLSHAIALDEHGCRFEISPLSMSAAGTSGSTQGPLNAMNIPAGSSLYRLFA